MAEENPYLSLAQDLGAEPEQDALPDETAAPANPYLDTARQLGEERGAEDERLRGLFEQSLKLDLETRVGAMRLAAQADLDVRDVEPQYAELRRAAEAANWDPARFRAERPELAELMLRRPDAAPLVVRDEALRKLPDQLRPGQIIETEEETSGVARALGAAGRFIQEAFVGRHAHQARLMSAAAQGAGFAPEGTAPPESLDYQGTELLPPRKTVQLQVDPSVTLQGPERTAAMLASKWRQARASLELNHLYTKIMLADVREDLVSVDRYLAEAEKLEAELVPRYYGANPVEQVLLDATDLAASQVATGGARVAGIVAGKAVGKAVGAFVPLPGASHVLGKVGEFLGKRGGDIAAGAMSMDLEAGGAYRELRGVTLDNGEQLPRELAMGGALVYGALAASVELWGDSMGKALSGPLGKFLYQGDRAGMKAAMKGLAEELATNPSVRRMATEAFKVWVKSVGVEAVEEGTQQALQIATQYATRSIGAGELQKADLGAAFEEVGQTVVQTARGGIPLATVRAGMVHVQQQIARGKSELANRPLQAVLDAARESPTARADAAAFVEAASATVAQATGEELGENVYVDPVAAMRLFQANAGRWEDTASALLGEDGPEKLRQAAATGSKLEVPLAEYLERWNAQPFAGELRNHITNRAYRLTPAELTELKARDQELDKGAKALVEKLRKGEGPEESPAVAQYYAGLEQQLRKTTPREVKGRKQPPSIQDVKDQILVMRAVHHSLAERAGISVEEVIRRFPAVIQQEGQPPVPLPFSADEAAPAGGSASVSAVEALAGAVGEAVARAVAETSSRESGTADVPAAALDAARDVVAGRESVSIADLQAALNVGIGEGARILRALEAEGVVGPVQEGGRYPVLRPSPPAETDASPDPAMAALTRELNQFRAVQPRAAASLDVRLEQLRDDPLARARELYIDPVSGLRNRRAFDETPRTEGRQVAIVTLTDVKPVNDNPEGGHDLANDLLRKMGVAIGRLQPAAARSGTNFLFEVEEASQLEAAIAAARESLPPGMHVRGAIGADVDAAFAALDAAVDAERAAGTLPPRTDPRVELGIEQLGAALDAAEAAREQSPDLPAPERFEAQLPAELVARAGQAAPEAFYRDAWMDKNMPGVLSATGWNNIPRRAWVASLDLRGLKALNDIAGKEAGDEMLKNFAEAVMHLGGGAADFAHLSGDEFAMQGDDRAKLESGLRALEDYLAAHPLRVTVNGEPRAFPIGFRFGLGEKSYGAADRDLNRRKREEQRAAERAEAGAANQPRGASGGEAPGREDRSGVRADRGHDRLAEGRAADGRGADAPGTGRPGPTGPAAGAEGSRGADEAGAAALEVTRSPTRVVTPQMPHGEPAHYEVREADELVPSHSPDTFQPREDYPRGVQERDYLRQAEERQKVLAGAGKLNPAIVLSDVPEAISGPPLVTSGDRALVLGGNGRTMMLQLALRDEAKRERYRAELLKRGRALGLDEGRIRSMRAPVLVRVMDEIPADADPATLTAAVRRFNESLTQQMSPRLLAVAQANVLSPSSVQSIGELLAADDTATLRELMRTSAPALVEILRRDGIITARNSSRWLRPSGDFTDVGKDELEGMFLGRVVGTAERMANTPDSLLNLLERIAPSLVRVAGINPELDETQTVQRATDLLTRARKAKLTVDQIAVQTDIFAAPEDPSVVEMARLFEQLKPTELGRRFAEWARRAAVDPRQIGMFEQPPDRNAARALLFGPVENAAQATKAARALAQPFEDAAEKDAPAGPELDPELPVRVVRVDASEVDRLPRMRHFDKPERKAFSEWTKNQRIRGDRPAPSPSGDVVIGAEVTTKTLLHGSPDAVRLYAAVRELLAQAVPVGDIGAREGRTPAERVYAAAELDGRLFRVQLTLEELPTSKRLKLLQEFRIQEEKAPVVEGPRENLAVRSGDPDAAEATGKVTLASEKVMRLASLLKGSRRASDKRPFRWKQKPGQALHHEAAGRPPRGVTEIFERGEQLAFRITLNRDANLSTFLHEQGHVYLEMLRELSELPTASPQLRADFDTLMRWAGADPDEVRRKAREGGGARVRAIPVEAHEKVARGFEAYFMEGKAPSRELQGAFQRFRGWLRRIYQKVANLNAPLNDEVRAVFGRLMTVEEEIDTARERAGLRPSFASTAEALAAGLTEAEAKEYFAALEEQTSFVAKAARLREVRQQLKDKQKELREFERETRRKAEDAYQREPGTRALAWFLEGQVLGPDGVALEGMEVAGLSRQEAVELAGEEVVAKIEARARYRRSLQRIWRSSGSEGPSVAEVAQLLGFTDAKRFLEEASWHPDRDTWVNETVEQRLATETRETEEEIAKLQEEVDRGLHGDGGVKMLMLEMKARRRQLGATDETPLEVFERAARNIVQAKRVGELYLGRALADERRAATRALQAAARGNHEQALVYEQQRLLNHLVYREMQKAVEARERTLALAAQLRKDTARARVGKASPIYLDAVDTLLEASELSDRRPRVKVPATLDAAVAEMEKDGISVLFDPDPLTEMLGRAAPWVWNDAAPGGTTDYRLMTVREFSNLDGALRQLKEAATQRTKIVVEGRREELDDWVVRLTSELRANVPKRRPTPNTPNLLQQFGSRFHQLDGELLKMQQIVQWIGGPAGVDSAWYKAVFLPIQEAKRREYQLMDEQVRPILELYENMPEKMRNRLGERIDGRALFPDHREDLVPDTRESLYMLFLNAGNAQNRQRLQEGRMIHDDQLAAALNLLEREECEYLQGILDAIEKQWPKIAELEQRMSGLAPERVEATPIVTRHGTFRGGYFPLIADRRAGGTAAEKQALSAVSDTSPAGFVRPATAHSHTKRRAHQAVYAVSLDFDGLFFHLHQVAHDLAFREPLSSVARILMDDRIQEAITAHLGHEWSRLFHKWLLDIGSMRAMTLSSHETAAQAMNGLARRLRANSGLAILGYALDNALGDLTNVLVAVAATELKPQHWAAGMAEFGNNPAEARKWALAKSAELRIRDRVVAEELRQRIEGSRAFSPKAGKALAFWRRHAWVFQEFMDAATATPIWIGAYRQGLAQAAEKGHVSPESADKYAVRFADDLLLQIFPSNNPVDQSELVRGKGFMGTMLMFQGYANVIYNRFRHLARPVGVAWARGDSLEEKVAGAARESPEAVTRALALAFTFSVMGEFVVGRGPDEGEEWGQWFVRKMLFAPVSTLPLGGFIESVATGKRASVRTAPGFAVLESMGRAFQSAVDERVPAGKALEQIAQGLALATGTPGVRPIRAISYLLREDGARSADNLVAFFDKLIYGDRARAPTTPLSPLAEAIAEE